MKKSSEKGEELIDRLEGVGGIILGVSENRTWIEILYEGDLMHPKAIDLPSPTLLDVFVEEVPHKSTVYEHGRTTIYLDGPCPIEICREGGRVVVRGCQAEKREKEATAKE